MKLMILLLVLASPVIVHLIRLVIWDCGLRINLWFIRINIKARDYQQEVLDMTRPLTENEKSYFEAIGRPELAETLRAFK